MKQLSKETLQKMTRQELCDYCRNNGIKGYSGKTKAERVKLINKELLKRNLKLNIKKGREVQSKFLKAKIRTEEKQKYSEELEKLTKENVYLREKLGLTIYSKFSELYEISKIITKKTRGSNRIPYITKKDLIEYIKKFGSGFGEANFDGTSGACVPIAEVLRDKGYGTIESGKFGKKGDDSKSFDHYWIRTKNNKIIDLTLKKEFKKNKTYWNIEKIKPRKSYLYSKKEYDFWKNRIKGIK